MLQPDGDLWYICANALILQGHHSFRASWVKGHVTLQAMRRDPDIIPDAIDNGIADLIAGAGATTAGTAAQSQLLGYYAKKQRAYATLIRAIIKRILRVSDDVRTRREALAKQRGQGHRGPQFVDAPSIPEHPTPDMGFKIQLIEPPPLSGDLMSVSRQLQLIGYWTSIRLAPISDMVAEAGSTWLELFTFFTLRGGSTAAKHVKRNSWPQTQI